MVRGPSITPRLAAIVGLLATAIVINYIDRGNLSTAATLIKSELHLSPTQLGFLLSAFFVTYILPQPFVGWLVDRVSASRVVLWGFVIWTFATILSGFAATFVTLLLCRLLLGLGESVSFPSFTKILAKYIGEGQRGFATGVVLAGTAFGPAFGVFVGGVLIATFGWRPFFIGFGLLSTLWIAAWLLIAPKEQPIPDRSSTAQGPSLGRILAEPSLWGASLGQCLSSYTGYFLLTWLPYYLIHERHWSLPEMGEIVAGVYCISGLTAIAAGAIGDRLIRTGVSPTLVRKGTFVLGGIVIAICLIGFYDADRGAIAWLTCAGIGGGFLAANCFVVPQTLAGPYATGRWIGVQNMIGNAAGIVAPAVTGIIVERTGGFELAFIVAAIMTLASAASWVFLVGRVESIDWDRRPATLRLSR